MTKGVIESRENLNQPLTLGILREELKRFATKDDLEELVTRKELTAELKKYATRDEIVEMFEHQNNLIDTIRSEVSDLRQEMMIGFKKIISLLENHEYRISKLELRFADKKKTRLPT